MELRSSTICFSKTKAKETRDTIKEVVMEVEKLEKEISDINLASDEKLKKYNEGKKYLENYNNEKANGAMLRSKINWTEHGERNTKFFLNLEKRNYEMKCITKLIDDQENIISEPDKILEYEENFYKNLYSNKVFNPVDQQKVVEAKEIFYDETIPKITENEKENCDSIITIKEMGEALRGLQNGKSPGSDGFTADFYKFFWPTIQTAIFESLTYACNVGRLSIDQRRGIINLIPKKDKDPRTLKNW
jgi:hypothetical protein